MLNLIDLLQRHRLRRRAAGGSGFTIVEMIVVVLVLAIITVPLVNAWKASLKVTEDTTEMLYANSNRDLSAAKWVADVSSVDAAGVSYTTARACKQSGTTGTLLVTFNSTRIENAVTVVRRASYWLTGTGRDRQVTRFECNGPLSSLSLTTGRETAVAARLGVDGRPDGELVFGAHDGPGSAVCNEFTCGLNINGSTYFELRAYRRVFGAGVPLEAGLLYGSAFTRQGGSDDRYRYVHFAPDGSKVETEQLFGNKISLAPGLGEDVAARFKVKQRTTGLWLTSSISGCPTAANLSWTTTESWVDGCYDRTTETWSVPFGVGTETSSSLAVGTVSAGGEYAIYTQLTENAVPKQYGGVSGFPMWFDWRPSEAVFVSGSGNDTTGTGLGTDSLGDGTVPSPVATIGKGLAIAKLKSKAMVLINANVASGVASPYVGQIQISTTNTANNTTLQGGLGSTWLRAGPDVTASASVPSANRHSFIRGTRLDALGNASTAVPPVGISIDGVSGLRIRQLDISSQQGVLSQPTNDIGYSTYGIMVKNLSNTADQLTLQNSEVAARAPFDVPPTAPAPTEGSGWKVACAGTQGATHDTNTNTQRQQATGLPSGAVAEADCSTNPGGFGGGGGSDGGSNGLAGTAGSGGAAPGGGGTGTNNLDWWDCDARDGGPGQGGAGGAGGTAAGSVSDPGYQPGELPTFSASGWLHGRGRTGNPGSAGAGGGGSGGGGGNGCITARNKGRQGASGGNGGNGGTGGQGGRGGGSAIAIYLYNAGKVKLINTGVYAASGGRGQPGAQGGRGASGGAGGGGNASTETGGESAGAGGGGAGGGGAGGNGGPGGYSVDVLVAGTSPAVTGGSLLTEFPAAVGYNYFVANAGGAGGAGGPVLPGLNGGKLGGGAGGPGGAPASATWSWNLFVWNITLAVYNAGGGYPGAPPTSDAEVGRTGQVGKSCRILTVTAQQSEGTCANPS